MVTAVPTVIVSDVHIGNRFFLRELFIRFLDALPPGVQLVLNGDVVDHEDALGPEGRAVLERLQAEARRRPVVWIAGNHDWNSKAARSGAMQYVRAFTLDGRVLIAHGHRFIGTFPLWRSFVHAVYMVYRLFLGVMAEPVHPAEYAKRWPFLYRLLRIEMVTRAVSVARAKGLPVVVCGHSHYAEDLVLDGVHYYNTGAWTERPVFCLIVTGAGCRLAEVEAAIAAGFDPQKLTGHRPALPGQVAPGP